MDILFPPSNIVAYFKKQVLLPHIWTGKDLEKELSPLQKACLTLQYSKVFKILDRRNMLRASGIDCSDIEFVGAGLTPLECCLKENACVLLSNYNPTKKTFRFHINSYISKRKIRSRRIILTALLNASFHIESGWSLSNPSHIPWGILDKDEVQAVLDYVDISALQVQELISHCWINWQKNIHYTSTETFFLNHLSPFYLRFPRCCMRYQFRMMAASVKHGVELEMFSSTSQLLLTLLDNALVFQAMLKCYKRINSAYVHVPDFDWISQNLSNILSTDFYKCNSLFKALKEYMNMLLAESVAEFDNNLFEYNPMHLPGYLLTRFKVLARGLACMDREENQHLEKLLDMTIMVISTVLIAFQITEANEALEMLVCCIFCVLTAFRFELSKPSNGEKIINCVTKLLKIAQLEDHIPFILMRHATFNIPIDIQEIYIPILFNFLSQLDFNLNIRSSLNNENLLLTSISNHNFTFSLLELLLELKVYPFTLDNKGNSFASRVEEFFTHNIGSLVEDDKDSLDFLKRDFPILQKPYYLKILAAQATGRALEEFPRMAMSISRQKTIYDFVKLHSRKPGLIESSNSKIC